MPSAVFNIDVIINYIGEFMDVHMLNAWLCTIKPRCANYKYFIKSQLAKRKALMKMLTNWHIRMPDYLIPLTALSKPTRNNIETLAMANYEWADYAEIRIVRQSLQKTAKDIIVIGFHHDYGRVIYSRHETFAHGAGQTYIIWDDKTTRKRRKEKVTVIISRIKNDLNTSKSG